MGCFTKYPLKTCEFYQISIKELGFFTKYPLKTWVVWGTKYLQKKKSGASRTSRKESRGRSGSRDRRTWGIYPRCSMYDLYPRDHSGGLGVNVV